MTRAEKFTANRIKPIYYEDMVDSFNLNPQTGFVAMVTNEASIIQSIQNLVFTNIFERPYQPLVGSKVQSLNFDLNDTITQQALVENITSTIKNFEPRANQIAVQVTPDTDNNAISISVIFSVNNINSNNPIQFSFLLPRVR